MKKILFVFLCALTLCSCTSKKETKAPTPNCGKWEVQYYVDEFGDKTKDCYFTCEGDGVYNDRYGNKGTLKVVLFAMPETHSVKYMMFEGGAIKVDDVLCKEAVYKNSQGQIKTHTYRASGINLAGKGDFHINEEDREWWWGSFLTGGEMKFSLRGVHQEHYAGTIDVSGFSEIYNTYYKK